MKSKQSKELKKGKTYRTKVTGEFYFVGKYTDDFEDAAILTNDKNSLIVHKNECVELLPINKETEMMVLCGYDHNCESKDNNKCLATKAECRWQRKYILI